MKITALSNHNPGILNNYIRIKVHFHQTQIVLADFGPSKCPLVLLYMRNFSYLLTLWVPDEGYSRNLSNVLN